MFILRRIFPTVWPVPVLDTINCITVKYGIIYWSSHNFWNVVTGMQSIYRVMIVAAIVIFISVIESEYGIEMVRHSIRYK